jgi:hypothetical protein
VIVCAGCDGSDSDRSAYSADVTAACLTHAGVAIDKGPEPVAGAGSNIGLRGQIKGNLVIIVFHRDASEARDTERLFEMLDEAANRRAEQLSRRGNAVMFWRQSAPTAEQQEIVSNCLQ